jgi:VanZ family protein
VKIIKHLSELSSFLIAASWTVFITISSLISSDEISKAGISVNDKVVHFLFYFLLVLFWSFAVNKKRFNFKSEMLIVFFGTMYGIIIEVLQYQLTNTRSADVWDVLANFFGASFSMFTMYLVKK